MNLAAEAETTDLLSRARRGHDDRCRIFAPLLDETPGLPADALKDEVFRRHGVLLPVFQHLAAGSVTGQLIDKLHGHPFMAAGGSLIATGRCVEIAQVKAGDGLKIRHGNAEDAVASEHAEALSNETGHMLGRDVLEHMGMVNGGTTAVLERQGLPRQVVLNHMVVLRGDVKIDPRLVEVHAASKVEQHLIASLPVRSLQPHSRGVDHVDIEVKTMLVCIVGHGLTAAFPVPVVIHLDEPPGMHLGVQVLQNIHGGFVPVAIHVQERDAVRELVAQPSEGVLEQTLHGLDDLRHPELGGHFQQGSGRCGTSAAAPAARLGACGIMRVAFIWRGHAFKSVA